MFSSLHISEKKAWKWVLNGIDIVYTFMFSEKFSLKFLFLKYTKSLHKSSHSALWNSFLVYCVKSTFIFFFKRVQCCISSSDGLQISGYHCSCWWPCLLWGFWCSVYRRTNISYCPEDADFLSSHFLPSGFPEPTANVILWHGWSCSPKSKQWISEVKGMALQRVIFSIAAWDTKISVALHALLLTKVLLPLACLWLLFHLKLKTRLAQYR